MAQGTSENPILLTSNKDAPAPGDWYGVRFLNTSDDASSVLMHSTIEYAGLSLGALYVYYASPRVLNCTIRGSKSQGIYVSNASPQIIDNVINDNYSYGLQFNVGSPVVNGNIFVNSGNYDIYITNSTGGTLNGNNISTGLYLSGSGLGEVSGNTVTYNTDYPLHVDANNVGRVVTGNTFNNLTLGAYVEVVGGIVSKDATGWRLSVR